MKHINISVIMFAIGIAWFALFKIMGEDVYKNITTETFNIDINYPDQLLLISYPCPQSDGTIFLKSEFYKEKHSELGVLVLTFEQEANFDKIQEITDTSFYSDAFRGWKSGRISINSTSEGKVVTVFLKSIGRHFLDYSGTYKLAGNKVVFEKASCKRRLFYREFLITLPIPILFFLSFVCFTIGVLRKIWPPQKDYSFLESPFDR